MCININFDINIVNLFSEPMAQRIEEGSDHVLIIHRGGRWTVQFVEEGALVQVGFDNEGQEAIEYVAGCPSEEEPQYPVCPIWGGECRHPSGCCTKEQIEEIEESSSSGCAWL